MISRFQLSQKIFWLKYYTNKTCIFVFQRFTLQAYTRIQLNMQIISIFNKSFQNSQVRCVSILNTCKLRQIIPSLIFPKEKKYIVKTIIIHFLSCEIKIQISWFTCVNSVCERCETQYTQVLQYCISLNHTKPEEHHCFGIQILKTQNIIHLMRLQRWKRSLWVGFTVYTNQYTVRAKRYMQIM